MTERSIPEGPSTKWFIVATILYLAAVLIGAQIAGFFRLDWTPIDPDEWGDVLAGVFSPLAFWWLLYTSLSQRTQLAIQQKEITRAIRSQCLAEEQLRQERQLWANWYLGGLSDLHDQLINYTAHLIRDISPRAPLPPSDEMVFQISQLPAVFQIESGLPKLHYLPVAIQSKMIGLLSNLRRVHRTTLDFRYRVRTNGKIEASDIKNYCRRLNNLAVDSWHVAAEGRKILAEEQANI